MTEDRWAWVLGYEEHYKVSTLGRVKSVPRTRKNRGGRISPLRGRILRQATLPKGYKFVGLCKDAVVKQGYIHRMVWEAFKGPIPEGLEVNHKDGDKSNNALDNLELLTHRENIRHGIRIGKIKHMSPGKVPNAKLSMPKARQIRWRIEDGESQTELAKEYGVDKQTITYVKQNAIWKE